MFPYSGEIAGLATGLLWAIGSFLWSTMKKDLTPLGINLFKVAAGIVLLTAGIVIAGGEAWPGHLEGRQIGFLLVSGIVGLGIGDIFYFYALLKLGPRRALLLWLTAPPIAAVLGWIFLGESIAALGWIGILLTLVGIAVVQSEKDEKEGDEEPLSRKILLIGTGAGILAGLGQAIASVFNKIVLVENVSAIQVTQLRLVGAVAFLFLWAVVLGKLKSSASPFRKKRVFAISTLAVLAGTVLGLIGMSYSQGMIPIGLSNTLTSTSILWALPIGLIFFKERITLRAMVGTAIAFGGVAMVFLH
jgi:drug/metabolite transporter (DMT)-like permease